MSQAMLNFSQRAGADLYAPALAGAIQVGKGSIRGLVHILRTPPAPRSFAPLTQAALHGDWRWTIVICTTPLLLSMIL